ncbi:MAG: protein kinase [Acidobacteria bacterium]|nr:protein kinase [Acidobacteriota bacterium]
MPEIGQTLSHFRLVEKIGQGGMGEVYLADDTTLDRKVALKFLPEAFTSDPERMARFEREAKLLASLNHPNIAGIYGLEQADGNRFLVLEYVEGETLQARLSKGALPLEDALLLCRQIAEGLEAAHEKGVIHRDLKPANVMITAEEKVKILDFGLAKAFSDDTQSIDSSQSPTLTEAMTQPGVILGTAAYMSPEQAKGKSVDKRADIWAFGCILYECLTGKKAFEGEGVTETLAAVIRGEPDWDIIPVQNRLLLCRCLEKDPKERLRDVGDINLFWESAPGNRSTSMHNKHYWLAWITATLALFLGVTLFLLIFREEPTIPRNLVKFNIALPENIHVSANNWFAVSPDGQRLAFIATDPDGIQRLWLHNFDSLESKPLKGTEFEGIGDCFWSPDSRFIAYTDGKKLNKIDVSSGLPVPICDSYKAIVGGSWNRDGVVIFGTDGGGLMRVSATGGSPLPLTVLNEDRGSGSHTMPTFLPDGKHFLYYRNSGNPENRGTYIGSLDVRPEEQQLTLLLSTVSASMYARNRDSHIGFILFLDDQNLMARRFDSRSFELIGEAIHLANSVSSYYNVGLFSVSDTGNLIFRKGSGSQSSQPTVFDREGNIVNRYGEPGIYYRLAFSPNGERAAASWVNPSIANVPSIWLFDLIRNTKERLTLGQSDNSRPIWSPNGKDIIFNSNRDGTLDLYLKSVNEGGETRSVWKSDKAKYPTSWSSDGRFVLYTEYDPKTMQNDLWILPLEDDAKPFAFYPTESNEGDGHFSPDMQWIAYQSDESGSYEIYVREFIKPPNKSGSESTGRKTVSIDGGRGPRWGLDSKELFYRTDDGTVMAVKITTDTEFEPGTPIALFKAATDPISMDSIAPFPTWDVNADGNRFILATPIVDTTPFTIYLNWTSLLEQ